jgi:hypothetical protein
VAFVTDEVRHFLLQKRIENQHKIHIQSNLAKSEGGFGGGYSAKDGKSVVGAAHGIEEMIKMATREKKKFSDSGRPTGKSPEELILDELLAEARAEKEEAARAAAARNQSADLLGSINPTPAVEIDFLDFGGGGVQQTTTTSIPSAAADPFGGHDLLGMSTSSSTPAEPSNYLLGLGGRGHQEGSLLDMASASNMGTPVQDDNLLSMDTMMGAPMGGMTNTTHAVDPFASVLGTQASNGAPPPPSSNPAPSPPSYTNGAFGGVTSMMTTMALGGGDVASQKKSVMGANEDRFSALDALAATTQTSKVTILDAKNAENRLLGFTSSSTPAFSASPATSSSGAFNLSLSDSMSLGMPPGAPPIPAAGAGWDLPTAESIAPLAMGMPPPPPHAAYIAPGTGHVAASYGDAGDDDDNPWVMGGTTGSGLQPIGPAPGMPPPPPPP